MDHNIVREKGRPTSVTVFHGGRVYVAAEGHPNFGPIVAALESGEATPRGIIDLFDIGSSIARRFRSAQRALKSVVGGDAAAVKAAEQIEIKNGSILWEGEEVHGSLADTVMAFYRSNSDDFLPLVRFMAKVMDNPNAHSRENLFDWMQHLSFQIAPDGDLLAYKGVRSARPVQQEGLVAQPVEYLSLSKGHAFVNGVEYNDHIPNNVGDKVTMPREEVAFDPSVACSTGLHVGTWGYALNYGDTLIQVKIDPKDVVSVPTDSNGQKMRVCGYTVQAVIEVERAKEPDLVLANAGLWDEEYDEDYDEYEGY